MSTWKAQSTEYGHSVDLMHVFNAQLHTGTGFSKPELKSVDEQRLYSIGYPSPKACDGMFQQGQYQCKYNNRPFCYLSKILEKQIQGFIVVRIGKNCCHFGWKE